MGNKSGRDRKRGESTLEEARGADTQGRKIGERAIMQFYKQIPAAAKWPAMGQNTSRGKENEASKNEVERSKKAPKTMRLKGNKTRRKADGSQAVCPRTRRAGPMTLWGLEAGNRKHFKKWGRKECLKNKNEVANRATTRRRMRCKNAASREKRSFTQERGVDSRRRNLETKQKVVRAKEGTQPFECVSTNGPNIKKTAGEIVCNTPRTQQHHKKCRCNVKASLKNRTKWKKLKIQGRMIYGGTWARQVYYRRKVDASCEKNDLATQIKKAGKWS